MLSIELISILKYPCQPLLALLILGYVHVMSQLEYSQLCMFVGLANLDLPHWNGLHASRL